MTKLRTQRTLKPAYTPAIRAFVEQTLAENLGGEWSAVMGNAIRSYGENIETAERQELHKDITLDRAFRCDMVCQHTLRDMLETARALLVPGSAERVL